MNFYINSPCYFTEINGICDDVYQMCLHISKNIDITKYTNSLDVIGITPIIAPEPILSEGKWREEKRVSVVYRYANISLVINYMDYLEASIPQKKEMILDNIFKSLFVIKKSLKNNFDYSKIKEDIVNMLRYEQSGDGSVIDPENN